MNNKDSKNNSVFEETQEDLKMAQEESTAPQEQEESINWEAEAGKFKDLYMRQLAELENMRRRFQKDKEELAKYSNENLIKDMLPFFDNLELALNYVKTEADKETQALAEGVKMTLKGGLNALEGYGLKSVEAARGTKFDPNVHEAMGQLEDAELEPGLIGQEVQKGYTLNNRLLRPSKVMVTKTA